MWGSLATKSSYGCAGFSFPTSFWFRLQMLPSFLRRMGIPYLRQKLVVGDCAVPLHASWEDQWLGLTTPRAWKLHVPRRTWTDPERLSCASWIMCAQLLWKWKRLESLGNHLGIHVMAPCTSFEMLWFLGCLKHFWHHYILPYPWLSLQPFSAQVDSHGTRLRNMADAGRIEEVNATWVARKVRYISTKMANVCHCIIYPMNAIQEDSCDVSYCIVNFSQI